MVVRIAGINIPDNKGVAIALTYIYGIGRTTGEEIAARAGLAATTRIKDLSEEEANRLREIVEKEFKLEGDLRREVALNINRLKEIAAYRGVRHQRGLPARGQRTKTNARTKRGKKVTMGSGKKKLDKK
jgi:small subunit ribosomal protein S13